MARVGGGYCDVTDLLIGDLPLGSSVNPQRWIDDAADEIDATIGHRYAIPIPIEQLTDVSRLTLKIINARLASGRLLLAQAQGGEDDSLHAYGKWLLDEATVALSALREGNIILESDDGSYGPSLEDDAFDAPSIKNKDEVSIVESFYDDVNAVGYFSPVANGRSWLG